MLALKYKECLDMGEICPYNEENGLHRHGLESMVAESKQTPVSRLQCQRGPVGGVARSILWFLVLGRKDLVLSVVLVQLRCFCFQSVY